MHLTAELFPSASAKYIMSLGVQSSSAGTAIQAPQNNDATRDAMTLTAARLVARLQDLHSGAQALPEIISLGEVAVPVLESFLRGPSQLLYHPRTRAADALGAIGGESALAALIRALRDSIAREPEPLCREAEGVVVSRIAEWLSRQRSSAAIEALLDALRARPYPACAKALGEMGDARAIPLLVECLHEDAARGVSMAALSRFGRAAVARLRFALATPHVVHGMEPPTWIDGRAAAAALLAELGDNRALVRALDDRQQSVRLAAAMGLARYGGAVSERALQVLLQGLDDTDWTRAQSIMRLLEPLGPCVVSSLELILEDQAADDASKRRHRRAAVLAGRLGLLGAARDLAALSSADDPLLRIAAVDALAKICGSDDDHVARFLLDPKIAIAARALIALNRRGRTLGTLEIYRWMRRLAPATSPWLRFWRVWRLLMTTRRVGSSAPCRQ
jgi:HEAT repeat protein